MRPASYIRVINRLNQTRWMHSDGRNVPKAPSQASMAHGTPAGSIPPSTPIPDVSQPTVAPPVDEPPIPVESRPQSGVSSSTGGSKSTTAIDEQVSQYNADYIPKYDKYGVLRPIRPRRKIPVRLPGGHLEPPQYPPSSDWVEANSEDVKPPHPLWKFFYVPERATEAPNTSQEQPPFMGSLKLFMEEGEEETFAKGGRSWRVSDLRLKSFQNLHTIWWLCLRELNTLATLKAERRRLGTQMADPEYFYTRKAKVRGTMANIKIVLNERRLALIASAAPFTTPRPELPVRTDPINQQGALVGTTWLPASLPELNTRRKRSERGRRKGEERMVARTKWPSSIWEEHVVNQEVKESQDSKVEVEVSAGETKKVPVVEGETDPMLAAPIAGGSKRKGEKSVVAGNVPEEAPVVDVPRISAEAPRLYHTAEEVYEMLRGEFLGIEEYEQDPEASEEAVVDDSQVGKEEVESRDEGFGGGKEAKEFVDHTEVGKDGKVRPR